MIAARRAHALYQDITEYGVNTLGVTTWLGDSKCNRIVQFADSHKTYFST